MNLLVVLLAAAGAALALVPPAIALGRAGRWLTYGGALAISSVATWAALSALLSGVRLDAVLPVGLPWIGARFHLGPLAAAFAVVVNLGAALASLYALGYGRHQAEPRRILPFYLAFLAAMNLVVLAADAFSFLVAWELMSLASWGLVIANRRSAEAARAAYVYLLMASFGALCLLLAFGLLAGPGGDFTFAAMRAHPPAAAAAAMVFALAILGAGSKAGLAPLHVWLPLAHPAAPSHVSALMSGVMTKVAVYAFIRIVFDLAGGTRSWWAVVVLALGGATAVIGVLQALMQHDLKRLLAYHTVENIGIVFIGLGLALAFRAAAMPGPAALAFTAALFHVFNHSLFKSLLFMGAGAVQTATGERDMDHLGGLIQRMPQTALAVLVGCVAISALPPLNGFASEWLTFQAILLSPRLDDWALKLAVPAVGALLALSAALAAACFVKAYGVSFLGRARTAAAAHARETDRLSRLAMFALALMCVVAGVLPGFVIDAIGPAASSLVGARMPPQASQPWLTIIPVAAARSSYNGLLVMLFIAGAAGLCAVAIHQFASRRVRRAPAWDCGAPEPSPAAQYTAASFAQPIRRVFGAPLFGARETVETPPPGDLSPARFSVVVHDPIWERLYLPIAGAVAFASGRLNRLQFLAIRQYLSLVFLALVGLLLVLAIWR